MWLFVTQNAVLVVTAHLIFSRAWEGPMTVIYGGRPANDEAEHLTLLTEAVCTGRVNTPFQLWAFQPSQSTPFNQIVFYAS